MSKQILEELKELRAAVTKLAGTTDLPKSKQLSKVTLDKVAKEFHKMDAEKNAWLTDYELEKYFKGFHMGAGKFLREEFGFSNYFVRGKSYHYNKADVQELAKELQSRKCGSQTVYGAQSRSGKL